MPFKTGTWGEQAKERNKRRLVYFRNYTSKRLKRLGYEYKSIGYLGEVEALNIFFGSRKLEKKEPDLEWNSKKIEVKTSSFLKPGRSKGQWRFFVKKQRTKCDYFLLLCKDKNKITKYIFLIPDKNVFKDSITIAQYKMEKYERYLLKVR